MTALLDGMRALHSLSGMKDGQQRARRHRAEPAAVNFSSTSCELEQHAPGKGELVLLGNESTTSAPLMEAGVDSLGAVERSG